MIKIVKFNIILFVFIVIVNACSNFENKEEIVWNANVSDLDYKTLKEKALDFPLEIIDSNRILSESIYTDETYNVIVKNNSGIDVKDYQLVLLGWDTSELPKETKINRKFNSDLNIDSIVSDIVLVPGDTHEAIIELERHNELKLFQPIVLSYTDFFDNVIENENAKNFLNEFRDNTYRLR